MRLLFLGNSNDSSRWFDDGPQRHELLRDMLAAEFSEPVEVIAREIWPDSDLPSVIGDWLNEYHPDVVYLNVNSYWFQYESVPLKVKRLLGRPGAGVGDAGLKLAESRRWSHNAVFRSVRRAAQATIGGDQHFTPEEVIEAVSESIRVIVRDESVLLVVKGSRGRTRRRMPEKRRARREARRLKVHHAVSSLCEQLHVAYQGSERPLYETSPRPRDAGNTRIGDGLHSNARGHERSAREKFELIRGAILAQRPDAGRRDAVDDR